MAVGAWKKEWEDAKKKFTKVTGKKKPKSTIDGSASKKTGLAKILGDCDKAFKAFEVQAGQPSPNQKKMVDLLVTFRRGAKTFKDKGEAYWKDIQTEMTKAKDKDLMNELDVLRKQIRAIADTMLAHDKVMESRVKNQSVAAATAKNLRTSLDGGLKRALLFMAQVKANNDVAFWNDGLMKASRDVYQQIGNVDALRRKGLNVPGIPTTAPPGSLAQMKVWRTGKPTFEEGSEAAMMTERMKFLKACQDVVAWLKTG